MKHVCSLIILWPSRIACCFHQTSTYSSRQYESECTSSPLLLREICRWNNCSDSCWSNPISSLEITVLCVLWNNSNMVMCWCFSSLSYSLAVSLRYRSNSKCMVWRDNNRNYSFDYVSVSVLLVRSRFRGQVAEHPWEFVHYLDFLC